MGRIVFKESNHTYTDTKLNCKYISVTTLIDKYVKEYDTEYWSLYKSIKDVLEKHSVWQDYKKRVGGWENVVDSYKLLPLYKYRDEITNRVSWYKDKWTTESKIALENGSNRHKEKELEALKNGAITSSGERVKCYNGNINDIDLFGNRDKGMFAELLMYNEAYKLAGQADLILKDGNKVWVYDYKTNKVISDEPFMDETFLSPLDSLYNTTKNHYMLQLSTYGWMLSQRGYEIMGMALYHIDRLTGKPIQTIKLQYRPDLVVLMLEHYKQDA